MKEEPGGSDPHAEHTVGLHPLGIRESGPLHPTFLMKQSPSPQGTLLSWGLRRGQGWGWQTGGPGVRGTGVWAAWGCAAVHRAAEAGVWSRECVQGRRGVGSDWPHPPSDAFEVLAPFLERSSV